MKHQTTCEDCVSMLNITGVCYCAAQKFSVNSYLISPSYLSFPRGARFGVIDIQSEQLVLTTDSLVYAQKRSQLKGYYRLIIQP